MPLRPLIECANLTKVFRTFRREKGLRGILKNFFDRETVEIEALKGIDLRVEEGDFVGLIGANGAGKTTLLKCLTGIVPATSGSSKLFGHDSFHLTDDHKRRLSVVMGQRSQLWWDLAPIDSFRLLREIYEVPEELFETRVREHAERLQVTGQLRIQLRHLSLGQRMKMEIIGAFLHGPRVIFLDEPTIGLDLVSREAIREFLIEVNRDEHVTIVLTSHDMDDIEETCRRIVILDDGLVLFDGDLVDLMRRVVGMRKVEIHLEPGSAGWRGELSSELTPFGAELVRAGELALTFSVPADRSRAFIQRLFDLFAIRDLAVERQPLESLIRELFRSGGESAARRVREEPERAT